MKVMKEMYRMFMAASQAHARWDYETSMSILRDKKKLYLLGLMMVPALLTGLALAAGEGGYLGGYKAYQPANYDPFIFIVSIAVGLGAGLITGCIGAGGGFIITPALMSAGVKGILAVGTDLFHIFAKAIMGTVVHKKLGNVSVSLAIAFLVGSGAGVMGGGFINRAIYEYNPVLSDLFISVVYVVLLGFLGFYSLFDFLKLRKAPETLERIMGRALTAPRRPPEKSDSPPNFRPRRSRLSSPSTKIWFLAERRFQRSSLPSAESSLVLRPPSWAWAAVFSRSPCLCTCWEFRHSPRWAQTSFRSSSQPGSRQLPSMRFTGLFSTLWLWECSWDLSWGFRSGPLPTKVVKGIYIRGFYALSILAGFVNRFFALPEKLKQMEVIELSDAMVKGLSLAGLIIFFVVIGIFALWVIGKFLGNTKALRGEV